MRLRSRDGLERVEVDDKGTVMALKLAIQQKLKVPFENMVLSKDAALLTSKTPQQFKDLADDGKALKAAGVQHGEQLFMWYPFERDVEPAVKKSEFEKRRCARRGRVLVYVASRSCCAPPAGAWPRSRAPQALLLRRAARVRARQTRAQNRPVAAPLPFSHDNTQQPQ